MTSKQKINRQIRLVSALEYNDINIRNKKTTGIPR